MFFPSGKQPSKGSLTVTDITPLAKSAKLELAEMIREDNLDRANRMVESVNQRDSIYTRRGKRIIDILVALIALLITLPINLAIAAITFFDVGRPILYKQTRVGKNGVPFKLIKFRNMTNETDANGELIPPSERVTKWGRFVRKTSLDELLNFWYIFNGTMSLIGPRPLQPVYLDRFNDRHKMRCAILPGLECPNLTIKGRPMNWQERLDNDIWYVENCSFLVDVKLALRLIQMVFSPKTSTVRGSVGYGTFMGYDSKGNIINSKQVPDEYVNVYCMKHGYASPEEAIDNRHRIPTLQVTDSPAVSGVISDFKPLKPSMCRLE